MEFYYELCGRRIRVESSEAGYSNHGVLTPFLTKPGPADYRFTVETAQTIPPPQGTCLYRATGIQVYRFGDELLRYMGSANEDSAHLRISRRGSESRAQFLRSAYPCGITPKAVLNALEAEHLVVQNNGIILHASFICWEGRAILFTAPSGTGKSTQAELWRRYQGAALINGDRAAVCLEGGGAYAWGIPFAGSSGVAKNGRFPLAAVVYLSQAPQNTVTKLTGTEAFRKVWEGCSVNVWDKEDVALATQTVIDILKTTPVYHLACTADQRAVDLLTGVLGKEGEHNG